jgi:hypothetical protein
MNNKILIILTVILIIIIIGVGILYYYQQQIQTVSQSNKNLNQTIESSTDFGDQETKLGPAINTLEYCELLSGQEYQWCVLNLAYEQENLSYCQLLEDSSVRQNCLNRVNLEKAQSKDISACFGLIESLQEGCIISYINKTDNTDTVCDVLTVQNQKERCQEILEKQQQAANF